MKEFYGECIAEIGSMTQAIKAQRILADSAIPTTVVKSNSMGSGKGCAYGVSFPCQQRENVERICMGAKIRVRRWKGEK